MKIKEPFTIKGYIQLYMSFYPEERPDVKHVVKYNMDFGNPLTEEYLHDLLQNTGTIIEVKAGVSVIGEYISKEEYEKITEAGEFDTFNYKFGGEDNARDTGMQGGR